MKQLKLTVVCDGISHPVTEQLASDSHQAVGGAVCGVIDRYVERYNTENVKVYVLDDSDQPTMVWKLDSVGRYTGTPL